MIIAINTNILSGNKATLNFIETCVELIAHKYPTHTFIFIAHKKSVQKLAALQNVQTLILKKPTNILLWKIWYQFILPASLKKIKADLIVHVDGICSLRTSIPQILLTDAINYASHPEWYPSLYNRLVRNNPAAFLTKASNIITHSQVFKNEIISTHSINPDKICVIYPGTDPLYLPISSTEKILVQEKYSSGKEYFLFYDTINKQTNLILLLKAFSFFKKRQKSNMQLIILPEDTAADNEIIASLSTYKYRNDVVVIQPADKLSLRAIVAAAYAFISVPNYQADVVKLLNTMQCNVPVITSQSAISKEILGNAALFTYTASYEDIADKMMQLFKDENKRNDLLDKAVLIVKNYHQQHAANQLWKNIIDTTNK